MNCQREHVEEEWDQQPVLQLVDVSARPRRKQKSRSKSLFKLVEMGMCAGAAISLLWLAGSSLVNFVQSVSSPQLPMQVERIVVAQGDTLWKIAGSVNDPDLGQADVVKEIISLNPGLANSTQITPGETIVIPAK